MLRLSASFVPTRSLIHLSHTRHRPRRRASSTPNKHRPPPTPYPQLASSKVNRPDPPYLALRHSIIIAATAATAMASREIRGRPKIFDGTYAESRLFLASIRLYLLRGNVCDLSQRVIITLNHIRGERVNGWVASKMRWLGTVSNDPDLLRGQDIWSAFKEDFLTEFAYPVERVKARKEIEEIKMEGIDLDAYIHNFCVLAHRAQYNLNAFYTIHLFLQGLPPNLVRCCVDRDKLSTFSDWVGAARKYRLKYRLILSILNAPPLSNEEAFAVRRAQGTAAREPSVQQRALTQEDMIRYRREGRCFRCGQHGHISKRCLQKEGTTSRPIANERRETQRSYTSAEITRLRVRAMSNEERSAWVRRIQDDPREILDRDSTSNTTELARTGVIVVSGG